MRLTSLVTTTFLYDCEPQHLTVELEKRNHAIELNPPQSTEYPILTPHQTLWPHRTFPLLGKYNFTKDKMNGRAEDGKTA